MLTDEELAEITRRARCAWAVVHEEYYPNQEADDAITFTEDDVPRLLDEITRLRTELAGALSPTTLPNPSEGLKTGKPSR